MILKRLFLILLFVLLSSLVFSGSQEITKQFDGLKNKIKSLYRQLNQLTILQSNYKKQIKDLNILLKDTKKKDEKFIKDLKTQLEKSKVIQKSLETESKELLKQLEKSKKELNKLRNQSENFWIWLSISFAGGLITAFVIEKALN